MPWAGQLLKQVSEQRAAVVRSIANEILNQATTVERGNTFVNNNRARVERRLAYHRTKVLPPLLHIVSTPGRSACRTRRSHSGTGQQRVEDHNQLKPSATRHTFPNERKRPDCSTYPKIYSRPHSAERSQSRPAGSGRQNKHS